MSFAALRKTAEAAPRVPVLVVTLHCDACCPGCQKRGPRPMRVFCLLFSRAPQPSVCRVYTQPVLAKARQECILTDAL